MRMAVRGTAIAIAAVALMATAGCTAHRQNADPAAEKPAPPAMASSDSPTAPPAAAAARITDAAFNEDSDGARVVLSADRPLLYTSYEPRPDLLVFDFPGAEVAETFSAPAPSGELVGAIRVEPITELGKKITRVTISHREGIHYEVGSIGEGLVIAFAQTASKSDGAKSDGESVAPAAVAVAAPVASEELPASGAPRGEPAHTLEEVTAQASEGGVAISLLGDGAFAPRDFVLANPPRIVVDLPGIKNEVARRLIPVNSGSVSRVRISQFRTEPEMVTRIVVDLARPTPHALRADGERLSVIVGAEAVQATAPAAPRQTVAATSADAAPAAVAVPPTTDETASGTAAATPAPASSESDSAASTAAGVSALPLEKPADATAPAVYAASPSRTVLSESAPAAAQPAQTAAPPSQPAAEAVSRAALESARSTPPSEPKSARKGTPARSSRASAASSREEALFEAAAAMLAQEEARPPGSPDLYQSRTLAEGQSQFTGEPISLDLKDADIKDVFRTISQLTGLNIVIDPEVRGTVTVQLEDVPWDQALDLILKQNGLGYVLENNIMRIATTAKLQAEQADRARLTEARQAAEPTRTVIKKLSYARAQEITPTLKSVMSRRGDIVVDTRTNTLIIREIPTFLPAVMQLIENLDTSTPQVMIESRIVETTKTLGRSLGINWGFTALADVAHGNTTSLIFPNTVDGRFRVGLDAGPTVGAIRLGNILNSFNLDIALTAAENQGLLKIISSPKVTALTNTAALIQSGVQIPVQTNVNNTTTVIYVDATLRLNVTPQITAEGTILLDVSVQKREPAVALNIALGQNVPLRIQEYRGQILVRDGGTTVIGGIFQINDQDQNNMIPGLWKIPILGNLFRNKTTTQRHDELLIFITPRILR